MNCPVDQTTLLISERQGVEIDYCPTCRGVWLDRGELDKILDRADDDDDDHRHDARPRYAPEPPRYGDDRYRPSSKPRKKKGFLSEVFDFD